VFFFFFRGRRVNITSTSFHIQNHRVDVCVVVWFVSGCELVTNREESTKNSG